jgi:hypothetical protein
MGAGGGVEEEEGKEEDGREGEEAEEAGGSWEKEGLWPEVA